MNQSQFSLISIAMAGLLCAGMAGLPLSFGQSSIPLQGKEPLPAVMVGAMAPPLSVETWVENANTIGVSKDGVLSFKKGQVYLIEFWGTRCGPCMESLPHLQEFQDAYPKGLTIVAVSIREGEPDSDFVAGLQRVKDFIAKYLKHATFAIAMDGAKQEADRQWMLGGELEAIPTAFLIDQEGRIAFIGHPLSPSLEATLSALMRGKFDLEAATKKYRSLLVERRLMKKARGLVEAGDLDTAIAIMDQLVAMAPNWDRAVALEKFQMLMEAKQFERAFSTAETIVAQPDASGRTCEYIASRIVSLESKEAHKGLDLALRSARIAVEKNIEKYPVPPATLAEVYWKRGDREQAIEWQKKAIDLADPEYKKNFEPKLEVYLKNAPSSQR